MSIYLVTKPLMVPTVCCNLRRRFISAMQIYMYEYVPGSSPSEVKWVKVPKKLDIIDFKKRKKQASQVWLSPCQLWQDQLVRGAWLIFRTVSYPQATLHPMSYVTPHEQRYTPWATLHELCYTPWATLHPMSYATVYELSHTLWATPHPMSYATLYE